jgi:hypothetical protein
MSKKATTKKRTKKTIQPHTFHYQKIDEYKWKYRGNIFLDKFPTDFTNENILSVYTEGITV